MTNTTFPTNFDDYMTAVDAALEMRAGVDHLDIDDWDYYSDFDSQIAPNISARNALNNAAENSGLDPMF